jgi:hypothetical protein
MTSSTGGTGGGSNILQSISDNAKAIPKIMRSELLPTKSICLTGLKFYLLSPTFSA